jgi:metallo-beta-lactamase class B
MRPVRAFILLSAAMVSGVSASPYGGAERMERIQAGSEAVEPFRVIGNIYFVGGRYGSYLITTPEGHILHDTGTVGMHDLIVANIEELGFDVGDIRIMISSHAHFDHVEGHAAMKRRTGAQVVALGGDAVALRTGRDNSAVGAPDFEPVTVDRVIEDGDTVSLGGVTLRALATPGHTQGATMWMTTVQEGGETYAVAFRGGEIPNAGSPLVDNPRHPTVVADTQRTLQRLGDLDPPDLFLHNHPQPPRALDPALPVDPRCTTCLDAEGWKSLVANVQADFDEMIEEATGNPGR